jgi:hypothetical protein
MVQAVTGPRGIASASRLVRCGLEVMQTDVAVSTVAIDSSALL